MKKLSLVFCLTILFISSALPAQSHLYHQSINVTNLNLRDSAIALARIDIFIPAAGDVVVRFDGVCYSDPGDRIILAANNGRFWTANYGNVGVETTDENIGKSFSHTRTFSYYEADAGKVYSFYAVGQNFVDKNGSGHASIYGALTAEYLPYSGPSYVASTGNTFNGDVTNPTVALQQTIHTFSAGKIIVRFDGWCQSDVGDRIVLAASNTTNWSPNDGNVSVEATSASIRENVFSHTREYDVNSSGDYTYYGVVQNVGETDGNGIVWVYCNLHIEFYPNSGSTLIAFQGFSQPSADLNDHFVILKSVSIDAPGPGVVVVDFDGGFTSDPGDYIELGASDNQILPSADGNVLLQAIDADLNRNCFAHSRVYNVNAGQHTFYALGKSLSANPGSGIINISGELMARFFPDQNTGVHDISAKKNEFTLFPNPTSGLITILFENYINVNEPVKLLNENGFLISTYYIKDANQLNIHLNSLPDGVYYILSGNSVKRIVKVM